MPEIKAAAGPPEVDQPDVQDGFDDVLPEPAAVHIYKHRIAVQDDDDSDCNDENEGDSDAIEEPDDDHDQDDSDDEHKVEAKKGGNPNVVVEDEQDEDEISGDDGKSGDGGNSGDDVEDEEPDEFQDLVDYQKLVDDFFKRRQPIIDNMMRRDPVVMLCMKQVDKMYQKRETIGSLLDNLTMCRVLLQASGVTEDILQRIPSTWYKVRSMLGLDDMPCLYYDACPEGHMLFTGEFAKLSTCPTCDSPRYDHRGFPHAKFHYQPISAFFALMYENKVTAEQMRWGHKQRMSDERKTEGNNPNRPMRSFWDGKVSHDVFDKYADDSAHSHALELCTDPCAIFEGSKSSVTPFALRFLNLPPWMSQQSQYIHMAGMVPFCDVRAFTNPTDAEKPPVDPKILRKQFKRKFVFDGFLMPLVRELQFLQKTGIRVFDAYENKRVTVKALLVGVVNDLRGLPKVALNKQTPALNGACHRCHQEGCRLGCRTLYAGHVRYLGASQQERGLRTAYR